MFATRWARSARRETSDSRSHSLVMPAKIPAFAPRHARISGTKQIVMAGLRAGHPRRASDGRRAAYAPEHASHIVRRPDVDGRHKAGHDVLWWQGKICARHSAFAEMSRS